MFSADMWQEYIWDTGKQISKRCDRKQACVRTENKKRVPLLNWSMILIIHSSTLQNSLVSNINLSVRTKTYLLFNFRLVLGATDDLYSPTVLQLHQLVFHSSFFFWYKYVFVLGKAWSPWELFALLITNLDKKPSGHVS